MAQLPGRWPQARWDHKMSGIWASLAQWDTITLTPKATLYYTKECCWICHSMQGIMICLQTKPETAQNMQVACSENSVWIFAAITTITHLYLYALLNTRIMGPGLKFILGLLLAKEATSRSKVCLKGRWKIKWRSRPLTFIGVLPYLRRSPCWRLFCYCQHISHDCKSDEALKVLATSLRKKII